MREPSILTHLAADLLNQAKSAATTAINTASNLASQAVEATSNLANQAANSQAGAAITEQAKTLGTQASALAGQAHAQAHAAAPSIVPPPAAGSSAGAAAAGVDNSGDLSPTSEKDRAKLEKLWEARPSADELQEKGILKGGFPRSLGASIRKGKEQNC